MANAGARSRLRGVPAAPRGRAALRVGAAGIRGRPGALSRRVHVRAATRVARRRARDAGSADRRARAGRVQASRRWAHHRLAGRAVRDLRRGERRAAGADRARSREALRDPRPGGAPQWHRRNRHRSRDVGRASKSVDPGKLDNLVGGGVAAGLDGWQTLMKECREEAGLPFELAQRARPRDALAFDYVVDDGLDANEVEAFDLVLRPDFEPRNEDGEVASFELLPFDAVRERLAVPHLFTVDAALVAWTCLQRWAGIPL